MTSNKISNHDDDEKWWLLSGAWKQHNFQSKKTFVFVLCAIPFSFIQLFRPVCQTRQFGDERFGLQAGGSKTTAVTMVTQTRYHGDTHQRQDK